MTRRQVIVWLLVGVLLGALLAVATIAHPAAASWRHERCRYQSLQAGHWTHREVRREIRCGTEHWSVPGGYRQMLCIAGRESGLRWNAKNATSSASGVFQIVAGTWDSWTHHFRAFMRRWGIRARVFSARANSLLAVRAAHAFGLGAWGGGC